MEKGDLFLVGLQQISSNLSKKELEDMKFLCKMKIGKRKLNEIEQGIELFSCLMQQNLLSVNNTDFLISMLKSLKRDDLIQELSNRVENSSSPGERLDPKVEAQLEIAFHTLCDHVGRDWRSLARKLGISQTDIERITYAYPRDLKEQLSQSLLLWKKSSNKEANVSTIQKALRDCNMNLTADILEEKLDGMLL
ncbi:FAS-associated death domain protein [Notamacropus eugenii]|uniref:FAS-associated death domain protein n=1 Tax=Notamacropus eugenii TaxID=9315 RepID=UPI003B67AF34